jgi:hypothetical protein
LTQAFEANGFPHDLPDGRYRVRVTGKIVNHALPAGVDASALHIFGKNEGWLVGEILRADDPSDIEVRRANPVRVDFDRAQGMVTAIEDRVGDGVMYCTACKRLLWSPGAEDRERRRRHRVVGPIPQFRCTWPGKE